MLLLSFADVNARGAGNFLTSPGILRCLIMSILYNGERYVTMASSARRLEESLGCFRFSCPPGFSLGEVVFLSSSDATGASNFVRSRRGGNGSFIVHFPFVFWSELDRSKVITDDGSDVLGLR